MSLNINMFFDISVDKQRSKEWRTICIEQNRRLRSEVAANLKKSGGIRPMQNLLKRLWREEQGQDLTEYALLLVLIALVAATTMKTLGQAVSDVFANAAANLGT
jgi:pilus assembly protein Flp/PilA